MEDLSLFSLAGKRILVVDDDALTRRMARHHLEHLRFEVVDAVSGEAALAEVRKQPPALVLLDVEMGGMDGFETCKRLRQLVEMRGVPILFITASRDIEALARGFELGASDFILKPLRLTELASRMRVHLQVVELMRLQREYICELSRAGEHKNRLVGAVTHDLKNPLLALKGLSEFLLEGAGGPLSVEQREIVEQMHAAAEGMSELVKELMGCSVQEMRERGPQVGRVQLLELVEGCVKALRPRAEKRGVGFRVVPECLPPLLLDKGQFRRVVENLLSNAVKFTHAQTEVTVTLRREGDHAVMEVRDRGPGIPEGEHGLLFKPLGRTSVAVAEGEESTGLGLSICAKIVTAHAGRIGAENHPEGGAVFWVRVPLERARARTHTPAVMLLQASA